MVLKCLYIWRIIALLFWRFYFCLGQGGSNPEVAVRLVGGLNEREGRVEVRFRGVWGTICDDDFDIEDAGVVCRGLGFEGLARAHVTPHLFGSGPVGQTIWLDNLSCVGQEYSLAECPHGGWGIHDCEDDEDAAVTCLGERVSTTPTTTPKPSPKSTQPPKICDNPSDKIKLEGTGVDWSGVVLYRQSNSDPWGAVCDDRWGIQEAQVVCRMLCYNPSNARAHQGGEFGYTDFDIMLDELNCKGDETDLDDCPHDGWSNHNCQTTEAASVTCMIDEPTPKPPPEPELDCKDETFIARFPLSEEPRLRPEHLTIPGYDITDSITDIESEDGLPPCPAVRKRDSSYVTMEIPFIGCGTQKQINATDIIYYNTIKHLLQPDNDLFTRTAVYNIPLLCVMGRNGDHMKYIEPEPQTVPNIYDNGKFDVSLDLYKNSYFQTIISPLPALIMLGDWAYVGAKLTTTDPNLKVVVNHCYATPQIDSDISENSTEVYYIMKDKCPIEPTLTTYPIDDTMFGLRFQVFRFVGNYSYIYIQCKCIVCELSEKQSICDQTCHLSNPVTSPPISGRRKREVDESEEDKEEFLVIKGPLFFTREDYLDSLDYIESDEEKEEPPRNQVKAAQVDADKQSNSSKKISVFLEKSAMITYIIIIYIILFR